MDNKDEKKCLRDSFWDSKWMYAVAIFGILSFLIQLGQGGDPTPSRSSEFDWNNQEDVQHFIDWKEDNGTGWSDN